MLGEGEVLAGAAKLEAQVGEPVLLGVDRHRAEHDPAATRQRQAEVALVGMRVPQLLRPGLLCRGREGQRQHEQQGGDQTLRSHGGCPRQDRPPWRAGLQPRPRAAPSAASPPRPPRGAPAQPADLAAEPEAATQPAVQLVSGRCITAVPRASRRPPRPTPGPGGRRRHAGGRCPRDGACRARAACGRHCPTGWRRTPARSPSRNRGDHQENEPERPLEVLRLAIRCMRATWSTPRAVRKSTSGATLSRSAA